MDCIELKGMTFYAFHGVMEQERKVGNTFVVDLKLDVDLSSAIASDRLEDTINYADVYRLVKDIMLIPSNLLEHVAGRILNQLKQTYPSLLGIEVCISKINPPIGGDVYSSTVTLKR